MNSLSIDEALAKLAEQHLLRRRHVVESAAGTVLQVGSTNLLAFASNDYLGLANDPAIIDAAIEGVRKWGVGTGASHMVTGHVVAHEIIERELAHFVGMVRALLFSTGYMANIGVIPALVGHGDAVFADKLNHASLNDAALLSRAEFVRYRHCDVAHLAGLLERSSAKDKLICTDGVFSMDGDIAPLGELLKLAERHNAWLLVDDAHGFGVLGEGRGTPAHLGIKSERLIYMGTLGKAAGVFGAFVAGHANVVQYLLQKARTYVFTTAMPPALSWALSASLKCMREDHGRRAALFDRVKQFKRGCAQLPWDLWPSETPIQPLIVGSAEATLGVSEALRSRGIWVPAIRPPTVAEGSARLRITFSANHTEAHVERLLATLADVAALAA